MKDNDDKNDPVAFANKHLESKVPDDEKVGTFLGVDVRKLSRKALLGLVIHLGEREEAERERHRGTLGMMTALSRVKGFQ